MKLLELHTLLQNSILTDEPLIAPYLCNPPKGNIADRVAIYTQGYHIRLVEVLEHDYSSLAFLLGEDRFNQLCGDYIDAYPSTNYSLDLFGEHLSQFLKETPSYANEPYWAEIATFEWAQAQAIIAKDAKKLRIEELQSVPIDSWPELHFSFHPSCQLLEMHWNSLTQIEAALAEKRVLPFKKVTPYSVFIWRYQQEVRYYKLNDLELTILKAIKAGDSFASICDSLCHEMPEAEVASFLVQELYAWINEEALVLE